MNKRLNYVWSRWMCGRLDRLVSEDGIFIPMESIINFLMIGVVMDGRALISTWRILISMFYINFLCFYNQAP